MISLIDCLAGMEAVRGMPTVGSRTGGVVPLRKICGWFDDGHGVVLFEGWFVKGGGDNIYVHVDF